jgi:hypothetical protein
VSAWAVESGGIRWLFGANGRRLKFVAGMLTHILCDDGCGPPKIGAIGDTDLVADFVALGLTQIPLAAFGSRSRKRHLPCPNVVLK